MNSGINRPTKGVRSLGPRTSQPKLRPDKLLGPMTELCRLETEGVKTCLEPSTLSFIAGATDIGNCGFSSKPLSQNSSELVADRRREKPSPCSSLFSIIIQ